MSSSVPIGSMDLVRLAEETDLVPLNTGSSEQGFALVVSGGQGI